MIILLNREHAQSVLEYALLVAVFALVLVASIPTLRSSVLQVFDRTETALTDNIDPTLPVDPQIGRASCVENE